MSHAQSPLQLAAALTELWSPRVIGAVENYHVKVAKVHGELAWHSHDAEDDVQTEHTRSIEEQLRLLADHPTEATP